MLIVGLFTWAVTSFGQTNKHSPFASYGMGWTPNSDISYSAEVGTWGTKSPTSFSATFDISRNTLEYQTVSKWIGAKAYYTVLEKNRITYMVYIKQAIQIDNVKKTLLEFGFNPNYTLRKDLLLGVTVGNQAISGSQWNLFSSLGFVYLFNP